MKTILPPIMLLLLSLSLLFPSGTSGQSGPTDDLLHQARREAFDLHDYPAAIKTCQTALAVYPPDPDIHVLLGRLYGWSHHYDSARLAFSSVLFEYPGYEDAAVAWSDLEWWNGNDSTALAICLSGLSIHPASLELRKRRVRLLASLRRYREARGGNQVGLSYDFIYFDRQYRDPWHLASVKYSHQTALGPVTGWVNYADRFGQNGIQSEAEAYPHISHSLYGYIDLGYSPQPTLFPEWRAGASLYVNLPYAFEADAGFRFLYFNSGSVLYTFSLGKYYRNFWFNTRCYLLPGGAGDYQSVSLTMRYYYNGADDYYLLAAGTGISPDDNSAVVQLAEPHRLASRKLQGGWRHAIYRRHVVFAGLQWLYQEYLPGVHDHQWDLNAGYVYRF